MDKEQTSVIAGKIEDYAPSYDEKYLREKIEASTPVWRGVNADEYVRSIREGVYEG